MNVPGHEGLGQWMWPIFWEVLRISARTCCVRTLASMWAVSLVFSFLASFNIGNGLNVSMGLICKSDNGKFKNWF